jgi:hypothetical protein
LAGANKERRDLERERLKRISVLKARELAYNTMVRTLTQMGKVDTFALGMLGHMVKEAKVDISTSVSDLEQGWQQAMKRLEQYNNERSKMPESEKIPYDMEEAMQRIGIFALPLVSTLAEFGGSSDIGSELDFARHYWMTVHQDTEEEYERIVAEAKERREANPLFADFSKALVDTAAVRCGRVPVTGPEEEETGGKVGAVLEEEPNLEGPVFPAPHRERSSRERGEKPKLNPAEKFLRALERNPDNVKVIEVTNINGIKELWFLRWGKLRDMQEGWFRFSASKEDGDMVFRNGSFEPRENKDLKGLVNQVVRNGRWEEDLFGENPQVDEVEFDETIEYLIRDAEFKKPKRRSVSGT